MNTVAIDIKRIEFVITNSCSGQCRHCSAAETFNEGGSIDVNAAVKVVEQIVSRYSVESIMTFGGEPLLYPETVCRIHATARDCRIPKRQIITNGYFSKDKKKIEEVAEYLYRSGINDVLLSVDSFHQEYIPLEPVKLFAKALLKSNIPSLRISPAWLTSEGDSNSSNVETKRILEEFKTMGIAISEGNNIFPAGNAIKYLGKYFPKPETIDLSKTCGEMPYTSRPDRVSSISISSNGDVVICHFPIGNIYKDDILSILDSYRPYETSPIRIVLEEGVTGLLKYAKKLGIEINLRDCYSTCDVCRQITAEYEKYNEES